MQPVAPKLSGRSKINISLWNLPMVRHDSWWSSIFSAHLTQFESYDFITSEEITALLLPIHSIRILLIRRRARKELFREASSYKVGHKLPMKHAVPQKEDFCINQTEGLVESPSTLNLWVTSIDAVYDGCSCSIPKCLFHKRFFIARWLSDNCLHFPFLIKFDLFIETKDCCGLEDG